MAGNSDWLKPGQTNSTKTSTIQAALIQSQKNDFDNIRDLSVVNKPAISRYEKKTVARATTIFKMPHANYGFFHREEL